MSRECYRMEELSDLLESDPADPRHEHIRSCVRCRNMLESLREFRSTESAWPAGDIGKAEHQMAARLERALEDARRLRASPTAGSFFARLWMGPWWRPALGAAGALVVVILAVSQFSPDRSHLPPAGVVRGDAAHTQPAIAIQAPRALPEGTLRFAWETSLDADTYVLVFYDLHLDELGRFTVAAEQSLMLDASAVRGLAPTGERVLWKVLALRRGAEIGTSPTAEVQVP